MREGSRGVYRASVRRSLPHWYKDARCALVFEVVYTTGSSSSSGNLRSSRDRDREDDRRDILSKRDDPPPLSDIVVATGIFLPFDGETFVDHVDMRGRSRNDYNSSAGSTVMMAPGSIFSPNGLVPSLSEVNTNGNKMLTNGDNAEDEDSMFNASRSRNSRNSGRDGSDSRNDRNDRNSDALAIEGTNGSTSTMVQLAFSCAIDESESSRTKRRELERKVKSRNMARKDALMLSRQEQARGEAGRMKKRKISDDEEEEEEEEEEYVRKEPRRARFDDDEDEDDTDTNRGATKLQDRSDTSRNRKNKSVKKENRSFFPDGKNRVSSSSEALGKGGPGSNSALVRSLLAQSLKQPLRSRTGRGINGEIMTTATTGYQPNATAVIGSATPLATELTRASRTYLSQRGFTDVLSDSVTPSSRITRLPVPVQKRVDLDVELRDRLGGNEVTFQFAAYRSVEGSITTTPSSLYFTYQFFNALPTRTERMKLTGSGRNHAKGRGRNNRNGRDGRDGRDGPRGASSNASFLSKRPNGSLSEPYILCRERLRDDRSR